MPFTLAHPAIVLPFLKINKQYVSATGLIAGSVAPDYEYFLRMNVKGTHVHTFTSLFLVEIPLAVVIAILFHLFIKNSLIDNLPAFFQKRFHALRQFDFVDYLRKHVATFLISVVIGAILHLVWDSFTHPGGFFVERLPFYNNFVSFDGVNYPLYYALQHISSYVGMTIIAGYIAMMKPDPDAEATKPRAGYWILVTLLALTILFVRFGVDGNALNAGNLTVTSITAVCVSLLISGMIRFRYSTR